MNKYGANDPMRNVYQEAARAKTHLNKQQRRRTRSKLTTTKKRERKLHHKKRTIIKRKIDPKRNKGNKIGRIKISKWEKNST